MKNVADTYNALVGGVIAFFSMVFGEHWILFAAFLFLNVIDWLSGWSKARRAHKESSSVGLKGIIKKVWYWVIIAIAFLIPAVFMDIGKIIGVDLSITRFLGWLTLAMLLVNEVRSIIENLVCLDIPVPEVLIKGLAITDKILQDTQK